MGKTPHRPQDNTTANPNPKSGQADLREARLKAALKANMARRKTQAAARRAPDAAKNNKGD